MADCGAQMPFPREMRLRSPASEAGGASAASPRMQSSRSFWLGPTAAAGVVLVCVILLWHFFDVPKSVTLRFLGYEAAFVAMPGTLAYMLVTGAQQFGLRQLVAGWALGYALEIACFSATAAAGARGVFSFYPLIAAAILVPPLARRWRRQGIVLRADGGTPSAWPWALAVLLVIFFGYLAEGYYSLAPLPWMLHGPISYYQDHVWELSLVGEALRQFPLQVPNLSGTLLHYHYLAYLHLAAVSQVTHIYPELVTLRLYPVPFIVLATLELFVLGRRLAGGLPWAGATTVVVAFLIGSFTPWPSPPSEFFTHLYEGPSASYGLGLVLLLAALIEFEDILARRSAGKRSGSWLVLALLLAACSGAKVAILPVLFGALLLVACYAWRFDRAALSPVVIAAGLTGAMIAVSYVVLYSGANQPIHIHPLYDINGFQPIAYLHSQTGGFFPLDALITVFGVVLETLKLVAPLALGIGAALYFTRWRPPAVLALLLAMLLVGIAGDYLIYDPHESRVYFLYYGYVPGAVLAGVGLSQLWVLSGLSDWWARATSRRPSPAVAAVCVLLALGAWIVEGPVGSRDAAPVPSAVWLAADNIYVDTTNSNMTPDLYAGLRWVAWNTPTNAIVAVTNRWLDPMGADARYCDYSAFAQRRVMLECDLGTTQIDNYLPLRLALSAPTSGPYPERTLLNEQIFVNGDRSALATAVRLYGVGYLLFDLVHPAGGNLAAVEALGRVVFANPALVVVDVRSSTARV